MSSKKEINLVVTDPNYPTEYFKLLDSFRKSKRFTDIVLNVAGKEFDAHKVVLTAASPFFNAMFNDDFIESKQQKVELQHESNTLVMSAVLDYIYSGQLTIPIGNVILLVRNFDYFQLKGVQKELEKVLLDELTIDNCIEFLTMADEIEFNILHKKAAEFLLKTFSQIYKKEELRNLNFSQLKNVLAIVTPSYPDSACKTIFSWVKHDETNRNIHLRELLSKFVKIPSLREDLVTKHVPKYILNEKLLINSEEGTQWLLENLLGIKRLNVFLFSMKADSPIYAFNIADNCLTQLGKQTVLSYFSVAKYGEAIYAVGGQTKCGLNDHSLKYDIRKNKWADIKLSVKRNQCGFCITDDKMYLAGGWINGKGSDGFLSYELESDKLTTLPKMEFERWSPALVTYNNSLYAFGGHSITLDNGAHDVIERYDPREGKWFNAGLLSLQDIGCTAAAAFDVIYCKGWSSGLQLYDPRCLMSEVLTKSTNFGTIAYYDSNLYLAHEQGISKFIPDKNAWLDLFISSLSNTFMVA